MTQVIDKQDKIKDSIETLYASSNDWVSFYRQVLSAQGIIRRAYPTLEAMAEFEQTDLYRQVHRMVTELRKRNPLKEAREQRNQAEQEAQEDGAVQVEQDGDQEKAQQPDGEPTRVITVRIPQSLHEALRIEAFEHRTSMNKLCISKLLQFVDSDNVPTALSEKRQEDDL